MLDLVHHIWSNLQRNWKFNLLPQHFRFGAPWSSRLQRRWPRCTICWVNLHHHCGDVRGERGYGKVGFWKRSRRLVWCFTGAGCLDLCSKSNLGVGIAHLIPRDQMALLRRVSMRTSLVPISFSANFLMILTALGERFLNPTLWSRLLRWIVHSRVTTSLIADLVRFSVLPLAIATNFS